MVENAKQVLTAPERETPETCFHRLAETYCITKRGVRPEAIEHDARQMWAEYLCKLRNRRTLDYDERGKRRTLSQKLKWIAEAIADAIRRWTPERQRDFENHTRFLREFAAEYSEYAEKARQVEVLKLDSPRGPYALSDAEREALHRIFGSRELTVEDVGVEFVESIAEKVKQQWEIKLPTTEWRRCSNEEIIAHYTDCIERIERMLKEGLAKLEASLNAHPEGYPKWLARQMCKSLKAADCDIRRCPRRLGRRKLLPAVEIERSAEDCQQRPALLKQSVEDARKWHGFDKQEFLRLRMRQTYYRQQIELGEAGINLEDLRRSLALPHENREWVAKSQFLAEKKRAEQQARLEQRKKANLKRGQGAKAAEQRRLEQAHNTIQGGPPIRMRMQQAARFGIKLNEPDIKKQPYVTKMILSVHKVLAKVFPKRTCNSRTAKVLNSWFEFNSHALTLTADQVRTRIWQAKHPRKRPSL